MMLKAKAACGDDDDSLSRTGLCSDFYVFKWVPTLAESIGEYGADLRVARTQPVHFQSLSHLSNHGHWRAPLARLGLRGSPIPNRPGDVHLAITVVLPQEALNFPMPQTHEGSNRERRSSGLGENGQDALYLVKTIRVGFLRLGGTRIDCGVAGRVLPLEIVLLLCQGKYPAHYALDVL
jgi:hypothetical protein